MFMTTCRFACAVTAAAMIAHALAGAQGVPTPFKIGTFERQGRPFVGVVLRESVVIDLQPLHSVAAVAGAATRRSTTRATSAAGTTMLKPIRIPLVSPTAS